MSNREEHQAPNASLAGLLRIEESGEVWSEADLAAIWRHQLNSPLSQIQGATDAEATFGELLRDEAPAIQHLQAVKRFAKTDHGLPRETAGVLYLAAIGVARMRLGERITESPDQQLAAKLEWAAGLPWLDDAGRSLLTACRKSL